MNTPHTGFSNDTLAKLPDAKVGDLIFCQHCKHQHTLEGYTEGGKPSELLLFYKCGEKTYLGAVAGKLVVTQPADCSGSVNL